jgi:hypothetical protein
MSNDNTNRKEMEEVMIDAIICALLIEEDMKKNGEKLSERESPKMIIIRALDTLSKGDIKIFTKYSSSYMDKYWAGKFPKKYEDHHLMISSALNNLRRFGGGWGSVYSIVSSRIYTK